MNKREQKFTTKFQKWLKYNFPCNYLMEVKCVHTKNYCFNSDKSFKKEMRVLKLARDRFIYKFPDFSRLGTPTDIVGINQGEGYCVITWDDKEFFIIEVYTLLNFIKEGHKSLSLEQAKGLCTRKGKLCKAS